MHLRPATLGTTCHAYQPKPALAFNLRQLRGLRGLRARSLPLDLASPVLVLAHMQCLLTWGQFVVSTGGTCHLRVANSGHVCSSLTQGREALEASTLKFKHLQEIQFSAHRLRLEI